MARKDWTDVGGNYCNKHLTSFTDCCPECYVELEEEIEELKEKTKITTFTN